MEHRIARACLIIALATPISASPQEPLDTAAMRRIRDEGFNHSRVLETALGLSDLQPPRLAGSPGFLAAAGYARDQLRELGIPRAWSPSTPGTVAAPVTLVSIESDSDFARYHGLLRGKIVLNGAIEPPRAPDGAMVERWTEAQLDSMSRLTDPGAPRDLAADIQPWRDLIAYGRSMAAFLRREGAVALLAPFADLGANHLTIANTGETDHVPFWSVGLPAFQFIQDRLDYETRVHHSDLDIGDYLREDDLEQAAVVMAAVVYQVAMRDAPIPRMPH